MGAGLATVTFGEDLRADGSVLETDHVSVLRTYLPHTAHSFFNFSLVGTQYLVIVFPLRFLNTSQHCHKEHQTSTNNHTQVTPAPAAAAH